MKQVFASSLDRAWLRPASENAAPYLPDADLEISLSVKDLSRDASLKAYTPLGRVVLMEVCA